MVLLRFRWALALALLPAVTGCGTRQASSPPRASAPAARTLKVALLSPGPVDDAGWNAAAYEGLKAIERDFGAQTAHAMTQGEGTFDPAFRRLASQGYDIIFAHGNEYGAVAQAVARQFPNTTFVISSGNVEGPNVLSLNWNLEQVTYLAGMLAAGMSKRGKAGLIGGVRIGVVESTFKGFEAGAKAEKPGFQVQTSFIGSWEDASAAKKQAEAMIASGADVLFHNADAAGLGVFQAADEHKAAGVYAIGSNRDQNSVKPDVVLASAAMDVPRSFLEVVRRWRAGRKALGGRWLLGIDRGYVSLIYNPALEARIPSKLRADIADARRKMTLGELEVPRGTL